jgi:predicted HAD superfamily Cof-like phosphohydrolase
MTYQVKEFNIAFKINMPDSPELPEQNKARPVDDDLKLKEWAEKLEDIAEDMHKSAETADHPLSYMRLHLLTEELSELVRGLENDDIVETLDALCDLRYVLDGTILSFGLDHDDIFDKAYKEVHRSNMSKLDENGEPIFNPAGRVVKSSKYTPPDLKQFFNEEDFKRWGTGLNQRYVGGIEHLVGRPRDLIYLDLTDYGADTLLNKWGGGKQWAIERVLDNVEYENEMHEKDPNRQVWNPRCKEAVYRVSYVNVPYGFWKTLKKKVKLEKVFPND